MSNRLLEREPAIRELAPYPADGSSPEVNPAGFRWLTHEGVATWQVQLAGPKGERLSFGPLADPILALPRALASGRWRWRYAGLDAAGRRVGQGRQRMFTVLPGLSGFVVPNVAGLARRWKGLRPRLLGRRIGVVRKQVKRSPPDAFRQLQQWCRLAEGEPLTPEPADFGPHPSDSEAWNRDWIRIYSAGKIGSAHAARFALSHLLTGNRNHLELAKRWAMHLVGWNPYGTTGEFVNDEASMPILERLAWVYDWLHSAWSDWERARYLETMQIRGQEVLLKYRRIEFAARPFNNHMCRQLAFLGGAGVAFLGEIPQAAEWLKFVLDVLAASYPSGSWGAADGGWSQGLSYWSAYMGYLTTFVAAAAELGIELAKGPYYRNTGYFAIYHLPPYAPRGGFGDHGEGGPGFNHKLVVGTFGQAAGDRRQIAYANAVAAPLANPREMLGDTTQLCVARRWDAWFLPEIAALLTLPSCGPPAPADETKAALGDLPAARSFPAIGWTSMHSALGDADRDAWIEFKSGPFGSVSHSHADQNSVNLSAFGRALLIDSGYYPWMGSPHDQLWTRQTWAHNGVLIGGRGQPPSDWLARGRIEAFDQSPPFAYVRGEAADAYNRPASQAVIDLATRHCPDLLTRLGPGANVLRASRSVVMLNLDRPVFVVLDWLETADPVKFQWLAHTVERMEVLEAEAGFCVRNGSARLAARFLWPARLTLAQTDQFVLPPEGRHKGSANQWHLTAETAEPATAGRFVTVLLPHREGEAALAPSPLRQVDGALVGGIGETILLLPPAGPRGAIRVSPQAFGLAAKRDNAALGPRQGPGQGMGQLGTIEADAAVVVIGGGHIMAAEATRLVVDGKTLVESDRPTVLVNEALPGGR